MTDWKDCEEYKRILEILDDYWLYQPEEKYVRVVMHFEHNNGDCQTKTISWRNPDFISEYVNNLREVEMTVLGSCLVYDEAMRIAIKHLIQVMFKNPRHRIIYGSLLSTYMTGEATPTAVACNLKERGKLNKIGGNAYLAELLEKAVTPAELPKYLKQIEDAWNNL